jgi:hypothetical protein
MKKDKEHISEKHPSGRKADPRIAQAIRKRAIDNEVPCAVAFDIANQYKTSPDEVGFTIDDLKIRIVKCQLGLYGYQPKKKIVEPAESVPPRLKETIDKALVNGRLACRTAWDIADRLGLRKMAVSAACEALGIKITACQLGAF